MGRLGIELPTFMLEDDHATPQPQLPCALNMVLSLMHREKKLKSLEVEAAKCAKLTDLFGAGFTSPAAAGAPGDERGGLDNDERVEADMVDHLTCESLRSCFPDTGGTEGVWDKQDASKSWLLGHTEPAEVGCLVGSLAVFKPVRGMCMYSARYHSAT
ncbi:unnamed protein product [Pleuronectes platessa]|uniref:Uncharacterized protein n=1 Tax=Pleuronectes platessa TaxID=8262 RepID=A0A9N7Z463_PLEPL|nr:unnamed protein product [Pleuronectes platessa]